MRKAGNKLLLVLILFLIIGVPSLHSATIAQYEGLWKGDINFQSVDESGSFPISMNLNRINDHIEGTLTGSAKSPQHIQGTVVNGNFEFQVPVSDSTNPDCSNWNLFASTSLDSSGTSMHFTASGTVCGSGGGKAGTLDGYLSKSKSPSVLVPVLSILLKDKGAKCATYDATPSSDGDCSDGKCDFQSALNASLLNNGSCNTIRLSQGEYIGNFTYFPTGNNTGNLEILGGWSTNFSTRTLDPTNTILNGNNAGQVLNLKFQDPNNPVIIGGNLKLEGVTVKNGKAFIGGGLFAFTSAPYRIDIASCIIENNHADDAAGGCAVGVYDWASTDSNGTLYMDNNIIRNNDVSLAGATDGSAGGCDIYVNGTAIVRNNLVYDNSVGNNTLQNGNSGGLTVTLLSGDLHFVNNTITGNSLVAAPTSVASGGGMSVVVKTPGNGFPVSWAPGHAYLYNNIIYGNTVSTDQSLGEDIANQVRNNTTAVAGSSLTIKNSNYLELWSGSDTASPQLADNISTDPLLLTNKLTNTSPCIDTGLNSAPNLPVSDLAGNARKWDGNNDGSEIVDMGCYEFGSL